MRILSVRKRQGQRYFQRLKTGHLGEDTGRKIPRGTVGFFSNAILVSPNNRLQRTVMDNVPRHVGQRAAAEPEALVCI